MVALDKPNSLPGLLILCLTMERRFSTSSERFLPTSEGAHGGLLTAPREGLHQVPALHPVRALLPGSFHSHTSPLPLDFYTPVSQFVPKLPARQDQSQAGNPGNCTPICCAASSTPNTRACLCLWLSESQLFLPCCFRERIWGRGGWEMSQSLAP